MIQNTGGVNLNFPQGGISSSGQTSIPTSPTTGQSYALAPSAGVLITVQINTATPGTYTNQVITLNSDSFFHSTFTINLSFTIDELPSSPSPVIGDPTPPPTVNAPTLSINRVGSPSIANNATYSLNAIGLNISNNIILQFSNIGFQTLNIANISISGDVTFDSGSLANLQTIGPNSSKTLTLTLSTASLGNKRITIIVSSNDTVNNPYRISLTYVVSPQANLSIADSGTSTLVDGAIFTLGLVNKGTNPTKTYTLRNNGVLRNVTVNSISVTGNVVLQSSPSVPVVLLPNNANAVTFVVSFPSSTVGQKSGTVVVDWS